MRREYHGMGEDEDEVVIEIGKSVVLLELLPDPDLISVGGDLLLQEAADLAKPLLPRLPQGRRRHLSAASDRSEPKRR
ncbi:hypothetical protein GW17_00045144 [Ensete ventricosum]|nr:hypothetical protein GW17_00045144 [Ensete ventricosum]